MVKQSFPQTCIIFNRTSCWINTHTGNAIVFCPSIEMENMNPGIILEYMFQVNTEVLHCNKAKGFLIQGLYHEAICLWR